MGRVTPRQVVEFLDRMCPGLANWSVEQSRAAQLSFGFDSQLSAVVQLIDEVPTELMPSDADRYAELVTSVAAIRSQIITWQSRGGTGTLGYLSGLGDLHPVSMIRRALVGLQNDLPSKETATLLFIEDTDLRASPRQDVSWASSALRNGEWKAATVLAGSVVEAMLFWELQQHPADAVPSDLDRRYLPEYIAAAEKLRCLRGDTIIAARLAQNYRNLIHQGRSIRLGEACDRGTAHVSIGALDHVVRDFENKECPRHRSN
jgi:hypothetical protein